jgi:hypothetical protein
MLVREKQQQQQFRSLSSRDLGSSSGSVVGSPADNWSKWGSSSGKADWAVNPEDFGKLRRSSSFDNGNNSEEPDVSWVQSLVKESPQDMKERSACVNPGNGGGGGGSSGEGMNMNSQIEQVDPSVLSAWMEQMQLDQLLGQKN